MLIINATLIDYPSVLTDYALYIEDGVIRAIGPTEVLIPNYRYTRQLEANGQLVLPGLINAHTHLYQIYARGLQIPGPVPRSHQEVQRRLWWPLERALDAETIYASTRAALVDAIRHGTTTLFNYHSSPNLIDGSQDIIAEAVEQAGLRAVLSYAVADRDGKAKAAIAENERFAKSRRADPLIQGAMGLEANLSSETLRASREAGEWFHIQAAQQPDDQKRYGKRVVQWLHEHGLLGESTLAAHCVHVDEDEIALLAGTGTYVAHTPRADMRHGLGGLPLQQMADAEIKLCMGDDGLGGALWEEWQAAHLLPKALHQDPRRGSGWYIMQAATQHNLQIAQAHFPEIGPLREGAAADLIFVDYHAPTPLHQDNLTWHILFGFRGAQVTATIVGGRVLMQDRQLVTLNEAAVLDAAAALAPALWGRYHQEALESI